MGAKVRLLTCTPESQGVVVRATGLCASFLGKSDFQKALVICGCDRHPSRASFMEPPSLLESVPLSLRFECVYTIAVGQPVRLRHGVGDGKQEKGMVWETVKWSRLYPVSTMLPILVSKQCEC